MAEPKQSNYWLDLVADEIIQRFPKGEVIVSSGHSPSGTYHVGLMREMATSRAIVWTLKQRGISAKHVDFVDDFDVLRKLPVGLPEALNEELSKPLFAAQSPEKGVSYGEYFYRDLKSALEKAGILPDETYFAHDTYLKDHRYTEAIELALKNLDQAKTIIQEVSNRKLPEDWAPIQLLSDNNRLNEWLYTGHDLRSQTVQYKNQNGKEGELSFAEGRVKLDWRLDWPARWWMWNVGVEAFGRDHASKGGSYDTGKELVKHVFGGEAPIAVPYDFILIPGQTKKLSKSAGGVITPLEALDIMPPEILRYFMLKSLPKKQLTFDSGLGLYNLIDEYSKVEEAVMDGRGHEFEGAYQAAAEGIQERTIARVPFNHLVTAYQTARQDPQEVLEILKRTGWKQTAEDKDVIERELKFVKNWLEKYAPEEVKFQVQDQLPDAPLTDGQRSFLALLATKIVDTKGGVDGQAMHEMIYAAKDQADIKPQEAFQAIYRVVLGKDSGPKAGWFLASLDSKWLSKRLNFEA
jgi:lysyl-tRNA synthetase class 1